MPEQRQAFQRELDAIDAKVIGAAMTDSQQANQEMERWQSSLTKATDVLGVSASMQ